MTSSESPHGKTSPATVAANTTQKKMDRVTEAWSVVEKSRHPARPHTLDYLHKIFVDFEEIKGDRCFGEDPALIAGVGTLRATAQSAERKVFFLGHQKGRNTKQKIERNFGMARPEGYRKAIRVMDLAERFSKPLLTLIDTPGAFPGIGAEERGQSEAIADSILQMFELKVPSVGIVIGEGGSGGALAIGVPDRLLMLENSTYSVISPESCAAILWGNAGESKLAAVAMKMSASENFKLGICDEVVREPGNGAQESLEEMSLGMLERIHFHLDELCAMDFAKRKELKWKKFRHIDARHHA